MLVKKIYEFLTGHWYALYVSGHGSDFKSVGPLMRRREALKEADSWVGHADTIGGRAKVENIITGKIIFQ